MVHHFPAQAQVKWIRGYEESDFLVVVSLWVDGWRWPILASHICVWFISGVRWSHLVAAPTLADKRQTTISPLVSDRAHQQITRAGGWEWEDWVELRTFYLNLNMTAMPFHYIWHQGSRLIANIKSGLVLLFRFIVQRLTAAVQWCQQWWLFAWSRHWADQEQTPGQDHN